MKQAQTMQPDAGAELAKVPAVTLGFWILKVLATTLGVIFMNLLVSSLAQQAMKRGASMGTRAARRSD